MTTAEEPNRSQPEVAFPLQAGETVLRVYRRHWIYLWPNLALMLLLALIPPIVLGVVLSEAGGFRDTGALVFWIVAAAYVLFWAVRIFLTWYRYHHDTWVLTSQRLIDSYRRHPFSLRLSTADLVNVQDMTVLREGLVRTALDYGDIICQTAADEQKDFHLSGIPHPREALALVDRERDRERTRNRGL